MYRRRRSLTERCVVAVAVTLLTAVILFISIILVKAQQEPELCRSRPADALGQWSWRTIEGRQCWYRGERMRDRALLWWEKDPPKPCCAADPVLVPSEFHERFEAANYKPAGVDD